MELAEFANKALHEGIGIYSIRLYPAAGAFHFEIQLDGLNRPDGAVSVADCEKFSRRFSELLDAELAAGKEDSPFLENLAEDNYTIEVSSAGAERELRLPDDLERFKGLPLKVQYNEDEKKIVTHAVYSGSNTENGSQFIVFIPYVPRRKVARSKGMKKKLQSGEAEMLKISLQNIVKINLFLDF